MAGRQPRLSKVCLKSGVVRELPSGGEFVCFTEALCVCEESSTIHSFALPCVCEATSQGVCYRDRELLVLSE